MRRGNDSVPGYDWADTRIADLTEIAGHDRGIHHQIILIRGTQNRIFSAIARTKGKRNPVHLLGDLRGSDTDHEPELMTW